MNTKNVPYQVVDAGLFVAILNYYGPANRSERLQECADFMLTLNHAPPYKTIVCFDNLAPSTERQAQDSYFKPAPTDPTKKAKRIDRYKTLGELRKLLNDMGYITASPKTSKGDADDLVSLMVESLKDNGQGVILYTRDRDHLQMLHETKVAIITPLHTCLADTKLVNPKWTILYKSLVGKSGEVKGIPSFGAKAFTNLATEVGDEGLDLMDIAVRNFVGSEKDRRGSNFIGQLESLQEETGSKNLQKILTNLMQWRKSYYIASPHPEWLTVGKGSGIDWQKKVPMKQTDAPEDLKEQYNVTFSKEVLAQTFTETSAPQM